MEYFLLHDTICIHRDAPLYMQMTIHCFHAPVPHHIYTNVWLETFFECTIYCWLQMGHLLVAYMKELL